MPCAKRAQPGVNLTLNNKTRPVTVGHRWRGLPLAGDGFWWRGLALVRRQYRRQIIECIVVFFTYPQFIRIELFCQLFKQTQMGETP
jgi:hypothetical protein